MESTWSALCTWYLAGGDPSCVEMLRIFLFIRSLMNLQNFFMVFRQNPNHSLPV
jgi:hypothetical protein